MIYDIVERLTKIQSNACPYASESEAQALVDRINSFTKGERDFTAYLTWCRGFYVVTLNFSGSKAIYYLRGYTLGKAVRSLNKDSKDLIFDDVVRVITDVYGMYGRTGLVTRIYSCGSLDVDMGGVAFAFAPEQLELVSRRE